MDSEALAAIGLFEGLTPAEMEACGELFTEEEVLMGDHLTDESDYGYSFFVVLAGEVKVTAEGNEVARLGSGEHFGEVALVSGERRNATVTATKRSRLAKMMTWDFHQLLTEHPALATRIRSSADERS